MFQFIFIFCLLSSTVSANIITVCTACHGSNGISVNPEWPNIAGQHPSYFKKQLLDMKTGTQRNPLSMAGVIAVLSDKDIDDLARYYATIPAAQGSTPNEFVQRGERLYRSGDRSKGIVACIACHGPKGTGSAQAGFPHIAGQHARYTMNQLQAFKKGSRTNDLNHTMHTISSRMSEEDIAAVAHYIEGLY